ncbi:enoyl-CoA hydratase/isomerase family protein [Microbaculum sp. FT89]|uniref:enoyl-CoA hydratase/isomerase family protein n=1 Tax=Microbaculum sp. FT89 TaxID=3447298 RepID=UPI003F53C1D9
MTDEPEILFEKRGCAGLVTLNRPKALNALTLNMVRALHPQLIEWANDRDIERVVVRAAGEKAFCAGGDIRQLYDWGRAGDPMALTFYAEEYRLNTYIKRYPKPYVALIDGIDMGGGVGISVHGSHRVAGGRTMFAMPETGIGLFPDVGGTYFLPRLPGKVGTWLALTGARLGQAEVVGTGVATHAVASEMFEALTESLCDPNNLDETLESFSQPPSGTAVPELQPLIDRCFSGETVEEILSRLDSETGAQAEWAAKAAATIRTKSPTSLKIALRQMQVGATADFEDCMRTEFRVVSRVLKGHDFFEGVRAVIIDKDNAPNWRPGSLSDVSDADVDAVFAPLGAGELDLARLDRV